MEGLHVGFGRRPPHRGLGRLQRPPRCLQVTRVRRAARGPGGYLESVRPELSPAPVKPQGPLGRIRVSRGRGGPDGAGDERRCEHQGDSQGDRRLP